VLRRPIESTREIGQVPGQVSRRIPLRRLRRLPGLDPISFIAIVNNRISVLPDASDGANCKHNLKYKENYMDTYGSGHQAWGDGATESLNPNFTFRLTKNMVRGDSHCEWVVERKK
jgi:hypothetical protein